MSTSSIGTAHTLSSPALTSVKQTASEVNTKPAGSETKLYGQQQGDNAFFQNVMQSLQSLGINLSSASANAANNTSNTHTQSTSTVAPAGTNAQQALFRFLHDLHQALNQAPEAATKSNQTVADKQTQTNNPVQSSVITPKNVQNTYGNNNTNLNNLINSLSGENTASDKSNNGNALSSALQTDFSSMVQALGATNTATTPTLQNFLQQLQSNLNQNNATVLSSTGLFKAYA